MDIDGKFYCSRCMRPVEKEGKCPHCGYDHRTGRNSSPSLEQGTLLKLRYQLGSVIGKGGFGITYAAWDETLQIPVAIKEYFPQDFVTRNTEYSDEVEVTEGNQKKYIIGLEHFIRESRVLAMMKDMQGVVKVQDYFEENNTAYIVMEYIQGISLKEYGWKEKPEPGKLLEMMKEPIQALIALHKQGVMHRDITPTNLLVQEDGAVKLIDFGSASSMNRDQSMIVVTQKYAPIEQYNSSGKGMGAWTDVYGLCATLYEVLTGTEPQESVLRAHKEELLPLEKAKVKLKRYQIRAIMEGLAVEPEKRPQSMEEFRSKLYNLPLPEEIRRRKKFMQRVSLAAGTAVFAIGLAAQNFSVGLPLGEGLLYSLRGDGFHIVGEISEKEERSLPETRFGIPITAIEKNAFENSELLVEVTVPGKVKEIGSMAFSGCVALQTVRLEEGVERVGEFAFAECEALRSIYLPDSLSELSENALYQDSVYLTAWGKDDGQAEMAAEQAGISFSVREEYEIEEKEDGTVKLVSYAGEEETVILPSVIDGKLVTELLREEGRYFEITDTVLELTFPEHLEEIPYYSFNSNLLPEFPGGRVQKAVVGAKVVSIDDGAFSGAALEEIELPDSLLRIGEYAFSDTKLEIIELPENLEELGGGAFSLSLLKEISIPENVQIWGTGIFAACENLETVNLPDNLQQIPEEMFRSCSALKTIQLPRELKEIQDSAFAECVNLEYLEIPDGTESIGEYAFENCRNLKYVDIPASVTGISASAFDECSYELVIGGEAGTAAELFANQQGICFENKSEWTREAVITGAGTVTISGETEQNMILPTYDEENHTLIRKVSVAQRANMETVQLPLFVETIGARAFSKYSIYGFDLQESQLRTITVPETVKVIEEEAFWDCENLESFEFPQGLEKIGWNAFSGCGLKEVILPDSLVTLEEQAFSNCKELEMVVLPDSLRHLRYGTFSGCEKLKDVYIYSRKMEIANDVFWECTELTLHGYAGSDVEVYAKENDIDFVALKG